MNTICSIRQEADSWLVEARTPSGARLIVTSQGSRRDALEKARWTEAEPA